MPMIFHVVLACLLFQVSWLSLIDVPCHHPIISNRFNKWNFHKSNSRVELTSTKSQWICPLRQTVNNDAHIDAYTFAWHTVNARLHNYHYYYWVWILFYSAQVLRVGSIDLEGCARVYECDCLKISISSFDVPPCLYCHNAKLKLFPLWSHSTRVCAFEMIRMNVDKLNENIRSVDNSAPHTHCQECAQMTMENDTCALLYLSGEPVVNVCLWVFCFIALNNGK